MTKKMLAVAFWPVLSGVAVAQDPSAVSIADRARDPQHKHAIYEETGFVRTEAAGDFEPFDALIYWEGNRFVLAGANPGELTYDPTLPDGSGTGSTAFYEYSDGIALEGVVVPPTCTGNAKKVTCSMTDHVFFVTPSGLVPLDAPLDLTYATDIGVMGEPTLDAGETHDELFGGAAKAFFEKVTDTARCQAALAKFRGLFASQNIQPHGIHLDDSLCQGL